MEKRPNLHKEELRYRYNYVHALLTAGFMVAMSFQMIAMKPTELYISARILIGT